MPNVTVTQTVTFGAGHAGRLTQTVAFTGTAKSQSLYVKVSGALLFSPSNRGNTGYLGARRYRR